MSDLDSVAMEMLRDYAVKMYYVKMTELSTGGYGGNIIRRKREIPYLDIAQRYYTRELDADGRYDIQTRIDEEAKKNAPPVIEKPSVQEKPVVQDPPVVEDPPTVNINTVNVQSQNDGGSKGTSNTQGNQGSDANQGVSTKTG